MANNSIVMFFLEFLKLIFFVSFLIAGKANSQTIKNNSIVNRMLNGDTFSPSDLLNIGLSSSVGSDALTVALNNRAGNFTNPTALSPVRISFRNSSLANGGFTIATASSSVTVTVPSGATLGTANGVARTLFIYALNNSGTIELAISSSLYNLEICSTTTISSGATSSTVIYSSTGRTDVPCRVIGFVTSTQSTAGTWATNPSAIGVFEKKPDSLTTGSSAREVVRTAKLNCQSSSSVVSQNSSWISSIGNISNGECSISFVAGSFISDPSCTATSYNDLAGPAIRVASCHSLTASGCTLRNTVLVGSGNAVNATSALVTIVCIGAF